MDASLISIIVPVYNSERYLEECVLSILNQTWSKLEVILIDDGSSDRSGEICDNLAQQDNRVRVIHKLNQGVSAARNDGIMAARGEILGFVDSDDCCQPEMLSTLYSELTSNQAELAFCGYSDLTKRGTVPHPESLEPGIYEGEEIRNTVIAKLIGIDDHVPQCAQLMGSMCRCLFYKDMVNRSPELRLRPIKLAEDQLFLIEYLLRCHKAVFVDKPFYLYRNNPASATRSYMQGMFENITAHAHALRSILNRADAMNGDIQKRLEMTELYNIISCITNECLPSNPSPIKTIVRRMHDFRKHPCFKRLTWRIIFAIKSKERIYYILIKLKQYFLIYTFVNLLEKIHRK